MALNLPENPTRSNNDNGYTGYDRYDVYYTLLSDKTPEISVKNSSGQQVRFDITQLIAPKDNAIVRRDFTGKIKTYTLIPK